MRRIEDITAVSSLPATPTLSGVTGYFFDGNPGTGTPATIVPDWWLNMMQEELAYILSTFGLPIDGSKTVLAGVLTAISQISVFSALTASATVSAPAWAGHIEAILDGAGGGGSDCNNSGGSGAPKSGGGGGAGGHLHCVWPVAPGGSVAFVVPAGTGPQTTGGAATITIAGTLVGTANGGVGAAIPMTGTGPGGVGGTVTSSGTTSVIEAIQGGDGSDGQSYDWVFAGNGAAGYYGGSGRAGNQGGLNATAPGAGGGGAYDAAATSTLFSGGNGAAGLVKFRWLP